MQNKVVLKHSRIEINNYVLGDAPRLEYLFSMNDPIRHARYYKGIEYDEANKKLILPRGFDISYLESIFGMSAIVDKNPDPYVNTEQIPIKYLTRDERQLEILKFIIGVDNYAYTATKSQLSVNSATGSGKTFVTVASICFTGARAILITNSLDWLNQWKYKIFEYTPLQEKDIYTISSKSVGSINKLLYDDPLKYQIFLISHSSIKSYGDRYGWDKVEEFFKHLRCSLKIFDEAHLYFDNMMKIDYHSNTRKTLYLTATPARSDRNENDIYQLYFKNIPSISLFDENKDPHVNYFAIHFNSHPSPADIVKCKNSYGFDRNKYVGYVTSRPMFLNLVTVIIDMCMNIDGKCLIYIGTNKGIMDVYKHIISVFPFLEGFVGVYSSISDKDTKDLNLRTKFILSTTKSCGAASDIPDLACTINLAEPFKSSVLAQQTLGRCRKDNTLYIDVVDEGFYFTKKYYQAKKPIFSRYAKSCKEAFMSDIELEDRVAKVLEKYQQKEVMCMRVYKK
jgi:hypothetical protein